MNLNHQITPLNIEFDDEEFTPSSLITAVNAKLTAREAQMVCLNGICTDIGEQPYYGYYFGKLLDPEHLDFDIKLKITKSLLPKITSHTLICMRGVVEKQISNRKDGNIGLVFRVAEVIRSQTSDTLLKKQKEQAAIIGSKRLKDSDYVQNVILHALRKSHKIRLLIITGERAITVTDVMRSLGSAKSYYLIEEKRINFSQAELICETLTKADQAGRYDIIALVRGGGDGLGVFSNTRVLKTAASVKRACLVTALGHFDDQSAVDRVADHICGTPTDFGYFLAGAAYEVRKEYYRQKNAASRRLAWTVAFLALAGCLLLLMQFAQR